MSANRLTGSDFDPRTESQALYYCLLPHSENNTIDKLLTLLFAAAWVAITIGAAYGWAVPAEGYGVLSAFVGYRIGTIKEREGRRIENGG